MSIIKILISTIALSLQTVLSCAHDEIVDFHDKHVGPEKHNSNFHYNLEKITMNHHSERILENEPIYMKRNNATLDDPV